MEKNNYEISLITHFTESVDRKDYINRLPVLRIEEDKGEWFFKDVLGNRAKTTKQSIYDFVFCGKRIKVFGNVYFYPVYYPQYKPNSRELELLKTKLL
jgi:hypothetical protein